MIDDLESVNSQAYWQQRFLENWEACQGPNQSRFFARLAIENLPQWLFEQIQRDALTFVDWGCAQGDGTDVFASYIDAAQITGVDFSSVSIAQAQVRYPAIRFLTEDWLQKDTQIDVFDVVFSSNTLEHFHQPYQVLEVLCQRASKAVILALPFQEKDRISEHFFTFLPENIPLAVANRFRLVWSSVLDCSQLQDAYWGGDQIFLAYVDSQWMDSLNLKLCHSQITPKDITTEIKKLNIVLGERDHTAQSLRQVIVEKEADVSQLNSSITYRDGQIWSLTQSVSEREGRIESLEQSIAERGIQIEGLTQSVSERGVQIEGLTQSIAERERQIEGLTQSIAERERQIEGLTQSIAERGIQIEGLTQSVAERESLIEDLLQSVAERESQIKDLTRSIAYRDNQMWSLVQSSIQKDEQFSVVTSSMSWRFTKPLRLLRSWVLPIRFQDKKYLLLKKIYWHLPKMCRDLLNKQRHIFVAKHLLQGGSVQTNYQSLTVESHLSSEWLIRANKAEKVIIIPCAFEFDELVNQRPINAAKYFSEQGYLVLFVAWQWSEAEILSKNGEVWPNVFQVALFDLIAQINNIESKNGASAFVITMPAPILTELLYSLRQRKFTIVYDIMDEWEAFHRVGQAPWFKKASEESLVLQADYVCAVSPALSKKFDSLRLNIDVIGNGYTPSVIGINAKGIAGTKQTKDIVVGYFGHLTDAWFDWELVFELSRKRSDIIFEIIGYGEPEWVKQKAESYLNIRMLGKVLPKELHNYTARWSAAMIPFVEGVLAAAVDPIKIYEYLYFGLPTIVTGIPHLKHYPMTYFANKDDITDALNTALQCDLLSKDLTVFLEETTWEARFEKLARNINKQQQIQAFYNAN